MAGWQVVITMFGHKLRLELTHIPSTNHKTRFCKADQSNACRVHFINNPAPEKWENTQQITGVWENSQVGGLLRWSVGSRWVWRVGGRGMIWANNERHWEALCRIRWQPESDERSVWVDMEHQIRDHCSHWEHWAQHSKHFTDDEENTTVPSILKSNSITSEPDERNAQYSGVTLYVAWNSIESDICCPSQFTPCCCHPACVCTILLQASALSWEKKRQVVGLRDLYV